MLGNSYWAAQGVPIILQLMHGGDFAACGIGGNYRLAAKYLVAWRGPVDESDFAPPRRSLVFPDLAAHRPTVQKHVQNVLFLPPRKGSLPPAMTRCTGRPFPRSTSIRSTGAFSRSRIGRAAHDRPHPQEPRCGSVRQIIKSGQ